MVQIKVGKAKTSNAKIKVVDNKKKKYPKINVGKANTSGISVKVKSSKKSKSKSSSSKAKVKVRSPKEIINLASSNLISRANGVESIGASGSHNGCVNYARGYNSGPEIALWTQDSKRKAINSRTPLAGSMAMMPGAGPYGHVAIVEAVNNDGTITVREADYKQGQVTRRTGTPQSLGIEGYFSSENSNSKAVSKLADEGYGNAGTGTGKVAYQANNGNYYSLDLNTGDKTKISKSKASSLENINKEEYSSLKKSLPSMGKSKALDPNQLHALKMVRPDVAAHKYYGKDAKGLLEWWDKYGKQDANLLTQVNNIVTEAAGGAKKGAEQSLDSVSYDLENDPSYQALPEDLRKVAAYFENVGLASNTEQGTRLIQSLQTASSQADAYMKQFFRVAEDTMINTANEYQAAFGSQSERLNKRVLEIQEDLAKNKEFLTLEEQSDLTRASNEYKANIQATQGTMAAAGLTQSTIRTEAETRLAEQNKGLVEDTQRQYGKRITELETSALRGSTEAKTELENLKRDLGFNINQLGRTTEAQVGSANMPNLTGYTPVGNLTGALPESKTKDIYQRAGALLGEGNLASLDLNI